MLRRPSLILRISWKLDECEYIPMSFVLDTGAPDIFFCEQIYNLFRNRNIIKTDSDMGVTYVTLFGHNYSMKNTPEDHAPANIIGLQTLCNLGLQLTGNPEFGYSFAVDFQFFE